MKERETSFSVKPDIFWKAGAKSSEVAFGIVRDAENKAEKEEKASVVKRWVNGVLSLFPPP